jgi:hypothetical protein
VRQSAAESKIVQFPAARSAGRNTVIEDETMDQSRKLPIGYCMMIWTVLAVAGWGAFHAALQFV